MAHVGARAAVAVWLTLTAVAAQQKPQARPRAAFDGVRGIVGDRVILDSDLERRLAQVRPDLPPELREREKLEILDEITDEEVWVQYGRLIGSQNPEEFERYVERQLQSELDEEVREYGSYTRMSEELGMVGRTVRTLRDDKRNELVSRIAKVEVLQNQMREMLLITPREMKACFDANPDLFGRPAIATIERVAVRTGAGRDPDATAAEAAAIWTAEDLTPVDLAARLDGRVVALARIEAADIPTSDLSAELRQLAFRAPLGQVSVFGDRTTRVLHKLTGRTAAERADFADRDVQAKVRALLAGRRAELDRQERMRRSRGRLFLWNPARPNRR